jgi:hypothetical protein
MFGMLAAASCKKQKELDDIELTNNIYDKEYKGPYPIEITGINTVYDTTVNSYINYFTISSSYLASAEGINIYRNGKKVNTNVYFWYKPKEYISTYSALKGTTCIYQATLGIHSMGLETMRSIPYYYTIP